MNRKFLILPYPDLSWLHHQLLQCKLLQPNGFWLGMGFEYFFCYCNLHNDTININWYNDGMNQDSWKNL